MPSSTSPSDKEIAIAFADYDRQVTITNFKVACILGMILMPAGILLDWFVYPEKVVFFLKLRLFCSALIALFLAILLTPFGRRHYRAQGVLLFMLPASFITWMIYVTDGAASPYYAGLNLVLLVLAYVLHWTFRESLTAAGLVLGMYGVACFLHAPITRATVGDLFNNFYFLVLTAIIVVTGSYFHSRLRFREFALRYELDANRQMLQETNAKLVELDQVKNRFFANISHELRTPLTLLLAPLESLLHRTELAFTEETRSLLLIMHSNGMRLLKLINDLLDLVRLESGRMEVKQEPLELKEFVRSIIAAGQQVAADKGLRLESDVQPDLGAMLGDRDKLEKIVLNLMFNALKFTPTGGHVEIRALREANDLVITVKDTGIGISSKNLPFVFDRFWQADNSSKRKYQGVGIGLSLVKELVEIQGGKVTATSEEGKGTTFTARMPFKSAADFAAIKEDAAVSPDATPGQGRQSEEWLSNLYRRAALFAPPTAESAGAAAGPSGLTEVAGADAGAGPASVRHSLLVADDEVAMLQFLKSQLGSRYNVIQASDGQQAVDRALQYDPDVILLDMNMPEKDGLQVCRELRQAEATRNTPIVLLTARADEETKLAALSAGASDFLTKPFSVSELHVRIRNLVQAHDYQQKLSKQKEVLEGTIDQLKETEMQLVQTEKMASLGRLSAGIIHEINNPLNFATTGIFTLRNKSKHLAPEQRAEFTEILNDVEEGLTRVKNIVLDLRTFTHPGADQVDPVPVGDVIGSALKFLSNEWKDKVRMDVDVPEQHLVVANKNRLIQVFINLLQNSLEAVRSRGDSSDPPRISISSRVAAGKVHITVRDNGEGIETKNLDKIFDPFFTTKDVGQGMGLGLSICYRIVREYGGEIRVKSERGKFCEFTLEFPENREQSPLAAAL